MELQESRLKERLFLSRVNKHAWEGESPETTA